MLQHFAGYPLEIVDREGRISGFWSFSLWITLDQKR